jgi:hypothetical protein
MNFIKKFKGTIVVIGMFAIVLAINFYYPGISTDDQVNEFVNEDFTEETVESAETQEIIIPVNEDVPIETTDRMETEIKEIITTTAAAPLQMSERDAEIEGQEESVTKSTLFCSLTVR